MNKRILLSILSAVGIGMVGCSASAPNDVTLTVAQGQCVTANYPNYEVTQSNAYPYNGFRTNAYMGESSPYCMALTLTNNNSGQNSNNIQVYQGGLSLSYTIESNTFTGYMIDYNAAGVGSNSFAYRTNQVLGNLALFDPNNCVTTQGIKVNTLHKEGGQCTFYLQVVSESMPVGVYPLNVNVNYTNGNANYNVATTIYQQVGIFAGGAFSQPSNKLAVYNGNQQFLAESISAILPSWQDIQLLTRDISGNIYVYDGQTVYRYNGVYLSAISNSPSNITDLAGDAFGNILAATQNGAYIYNGYAGESAVWTQISGIPTTNISAIQAESQNVQNVVYFTNTSVGVESCILTGSTCSAPNLIYSGSNFNNQALNVNKITNKIIWASESQVYNSSLNPLTNNGYVLNQRGKLGFDKFGLIYVGNKSGDLNPAVFNNVTLASNLAPLMDYESNVLFGRSEGVYLRSFNYRNSAIMSLYTYGQNLSSLTPIVNQNLVLLTMAVESQPVNQYVAKSNWTAITGFNGKVNNVIVSSRLSVESSF